MTSSSQEEDNSMHRHFHSQTTISHCSSSVEVSNFHSTPTTPTPLKTQHDDLFIHTRTWLQDPNIGPTGGNRPKTFYILEQGDYEEKEGFWVEDDASKAKQALVHSTMTFWQLNDHDASILKRLQRRTLQPCKKPKKQNR